ncbi:MAG: capsule biosynthesis protein [Rhodobacterales bacterium]|nr:MAG: capsule biosynthesis protein [Rhodobacterales bacterium]
MTTKPRAKKFRIRRSGAAAPSGKAGGEAPAPQPPQQPRRLNPMEELAMAGHEDGFPPEGVNTAGRKPASPAGEDAEIAAIRQEGLTGRQLRMARRVAQRNGINAVSDFDAVRQLRARGIDPFRHKAMMELASSGAGQAPGGGEGKPLGKIQLPQVKTEQPNLPSTDVMDAAARARSVMEIQQDIAHRRRRKMAMLFLRLACLVLLPTLIAGYYYYAIATPMYATKSEFVIKTAGGGASGAASLFAGSALATVQDSITVQSYLSSRDAMLRLDGDLGFKAHFQNLEIDPLQRLDPDATNERAYAVYKDRVKIGFDPTEGIIKMEVVAADPETSAAFSNALIRYAEERVIDLTQRLREDQMAGARESYEEAEQAMLAAQNEVLRLQQEMGVFDATSDAAAVMGQISGLETQLQQKNLQLQQLLDNARPNQARVEGVRGDIRRLEALIADLRSKLTVAGGSSGNSLASVSGQLRIAETNLATRTALMQQALQQLEVARIEANKQTRFLEPGVTPVAPDEPTYPRAFENTILAFLIFSGIYLMVSLTASILREQVSS